MEWKLETEMELNKCVEQLLNPTRQENREIIYERLFEIFRKMGISIYE